MKDLSERFLAEHVDPKCRPSTAAEYKRLLEHFILPQLGRLQVAEVTRADIGRLHHARRQFPYEANRMLAVASKMFSLAERWGLRPDNTNPCRHIDRFREQRRERFLSPAELAKLGEVLRDAEGERAADLRPAPFAVAAIRLLLLTGCRCSEVLGMRWNDVDFELSRIRIPQSKTGPVNDARKLIHLDARKLIHLQR